MARPRTASFDPDLFLAKVGKGKTGLVSRKKNTIFSQEDAAEGVYYIQTGKVKLTVVSQQGKEPLSRFWNGAPFLENPAFPATRFER
jgi:CRP/FNR family transcriptional regulator, cyclic AMP receptor protein